MYEFKEFGNIIYFPSIVTILIITATIEIDVHLIESKSSSFKYFYELIVNRIEFQPSTIFRSPAILTSCLKSSLGIPIAIILIKYSYKLSITITLKREFSLAIVWILIIKLIINSPIYEWEIV